MGSMVSWTICPWGPRIAPTDTRVDEALLLPPHPELLICVTNIPGCASWDTRPGAPNKTRARRLHHEKGNLWGRENRGAVATFQDTKPGADFQTGQVWGRFPPHTAPQRPLWPLLAERPQKSHLASLSRACIPLSLETAFSHNPSPGAEGGSRSLRWGSRPSGRRRLSPSSVLLHSGCCPGRKVKGSDKVIGCRLLQGATQKEPGWSRGMSTAICSTVYEQARVCRYA